jgi:HK97 gp10 family phage protein
MAATLKNRIPQIAAELRPQVSAAARATAEQVQESAWARVPVDEGDLYEAIHIERRAQASYAVVAGNDEGVFYGHLVEFGSTNNAPQPFLLPAVEANQETAVALMTAALRGLKV